MPAPLGEVVGAVVGEVVVPLGEEVVLLGEVKGEVVGEVPAPVGEVMRLLCKGDMPTGEAKVAEEGVVPAGGVLVPLGEVGAPFGVLLPFEEGV